MPDYPAGPEPSTNLLHGVQRHDSGSWNRLVNLYAPVVARWCRRRGLQDADADNVVQEVFLAVRRKVADFRRDQEGATFHGWIRTIAINKINDHDRRRGKEPPAVGGSDFLHQVHQEPAPAEDDTEGTGELLRRILDLIRTDFEEKTWQAFLRSAVEGHATTDIANDLGLSTNAVRLAKSRVLRRLRAEIDGLL